MKNKTMKYIYVVTGIRFGYKYYNQNRGKDGIYHSYRKRTSHTQRKSFGIIEKRSWGWFSNLADAKEAVEKNSDIIRCDGCPELVIERFIEGYCCVPLEWWYKWKGSMEEGTYKPWKKPASYKNVICFGMG